MGCGLAKVGVDQPRWLWVCGMWIGQGGCGCGYGGCRSAKVGLGLPKWGLGYVRRWVAWMWIEAHGRG